ncbi:hypothetical protein MMC12_007327 [Toensbergia leucococca]|nr:hypothetical protein [Toensbergia leucococca]
MSPLGSINGKPIAGPPRPRRQNYVLKLHLRPKGITNPPIIRILSCPADKSFHQLHQAIQIAFDWSANHTYDYTVGKSSIGDPSELGFLEYIKLRQAQDQAQFALIDPLAESSSSSMPKDDKLLRIFHEQVYIAHAPQIAGAPRGGFTSDYMHSNDRMKPDMPETASHKLCLSDVFDDPRYQGQGLVYTYDFGGNGNWRHIVTILGRANTTSQFVCLDGEGHGCAESVGGSKNWQELKDASRAKNPTKDQKEHLWWYENACSNADALGLKNGREHVWDRAEVNMMLAETKWSSFNYDHRHIMQKSGQASRGPKIIFTPTR